MAVRPGAGRECPTTPCMRACCSRPCKVFNDIWVAGPLLRVQPVLGRAVRVCVVLRPCRRLCSPRLGTLVRSSRHRVEIDRACFAIFAVLDEARGPPRVNVL